MAPTRSRLVLLLVVLVSGVAAAAEPVVLTVLHVNDTHGALRPGCVPGAATNAGFTRAATLIRRERAAAPGPVLTLHAGDLISRGSPVTVASAGAADFAALAAVGVDALTPGNGDFYFGPANLTAQVARAGLPVVLCNGAWKDSGAALFPPSRVVTTATVRVGIVGVGTIRTDHHAATNLVMLNAVASARAEARRLRPQVDLLIALSHLGALTDGALAVDVPEFDLVVGGHSHTVLRTPNRFPRPDGGRPCAVVQAGDLCRFVGEVTVRLEPRPDGGFDPTAIDARLLDVGADLPEDPQVDAVLRGFEAPLARTVATLAAPVTRDALAAGLAEELRRATGADAALVDTGAVQIGLPQGAVTLADVYRVHPWRNRAVTCRIPAAALVQAAGTKGIVCAGVEPSAASNAPPRFVVGGRPFASNDLCRVALGAYAASLLPAVQAAHPVDAGLRLDEALLRMLTRPDGVPR